MRRTLRPPAALVVLVAIVAVAGPSPAAPRVWTRTADLGTPRAGHTLTVLEGPRCGPSCGKVLAAGGQRAAGELLDTAELYDPVARTWSPTGSLPRPRADQTATLLADGRVLVAGGRIADGVGPSATADVYDPATGTWSPTGSMRLERGGHAAILLAGPDCGSNCGKVLVAGGASDLEGPLGGGTTVVELYDPRNGTWELTGPLSLARSAPTFVVLLAEPGCAPRCGKVLLLGPKIDQLRGGGSGNREAELYDPLSGLWTSAGSRVANGNLGAMAQLSDGSVLAVDTNNGQYTNLPRGADRFIPLTGVWTPAKPPPYQGVELLIRLPGGRLLAPGGQGTNPVLYRPGDDTWEVTDTLNEPRQGNHAVLLDCRSTRGRVLVAGGHRASPEGGFSLAGSELYDRVPTVQSLAPATGAVAGGSTVRLGGTGLANGAVVIRFGDRDATVVDVDPAGTEITVVSPAGAAQGAVPVTVTVDGVPAEVCGPQFTYGPNPSGPNVRELSVTGIGVPEGDRGTTPAKLRVSLNQPLNRALSVRYATHDATATAGEDYAATRGDANIPAGETSVEVAVDIVGDTADEPDETFTLAVAADDAAIRVAVPQATATIVDDDGPIAPGITPPAGVPDPAVIGPGAPQPGDVSGLPGNLPGPGPGSPTNPLANPGSATQPGTGLASQPGTGLATQPGPGLATQPGGAVQSAPVVQAAPAAQVQAQSVAQAQPAIMVERQRQAQVARAEDTYLASAHRSSSLPSPVLPLAGGVVATLVALAWPSMATASAGDRHRHGAGRGRRRR